jgi:hypothetical protein
VRVDPVRRGAPRRARLLALAVLVGAGAAACGVEVPDDVAAEVASSSTTEPGAPPTTATPTSGDELEQALIDNGYSLEEARCGAANLRDELDEDEIASIVDADTIEDISPGVARDFADALRPCVEDGSGVDDDPDGGDPDDTDPDGGSRGPGGGDDDDGIGREMPGFGDDSEGAVSRSRFLSALIVAGVPDDQARCIVDEAFARLDQADIDLLFHADSEADIPPDLLAEYDAIVEGCA